jgi:hypothetical protein
MQSLAPHNTNHPHPFIHKVYIIIPIMRQLIAAAFLYGAFAQENQDINITDGGSGGELFGNMSDFNITTPILMEPGPAIIDSELGADICTYRPNSK